MSLENKTLLGGWISTVAEVSRRDKSLGEKNLPGRGEEFAWLMRGIEFVFDSIDLLCYELYKISLNRGRSYIDSPEWLKNKKATTNPKNKDDNWFQYVLTVALNYQNVKKDPQRI